VPVSQKIVLLERWAKHTHIYINDNKMTGSEFVEQFFLCYGDVELIASEILME
jgi:hypothetical protein